MEEQLFIDELVVNVGDEPSEQERQQVVTPERQRHTTARQEAAMEETHFSTLLIRLNRVEAAIGSNHQEIVHDLSSFRTYAGERFSAVTKSLGRVSHQAPHQMWHYMNQQQQRRMEAQAEMVAINVVEGDGPGVEGGQGGGNDENENPQDPPPPGNNKRRPTGFLVNGAILSARPKSLEDLWTEWCWGIGGNKPAKDFTAAERGACKFTYCRRKVFWDCVRAHMRAGFSHEAAIHRIKCAYGHSTSVSKVLKAMQAHKKNGGHPNLQL